ncbi:MerR family transcriptional regulator [Streptomyces lavendofoliae]|uniref:DNA polymerase III subunit beta family protein n=1 Tax=Streptomyces lavendofoliae TaxID=67314 RepID=UPI003D8C8550
MDETTEARLTIGAFARRVGLAPSALRFYDDCGVLRPAHIDDATGYRFYDPGQEVRAGLVRRLREAGLPLVDVVAVLDGSPDEARAVLENHALRSRRTAAAAQAAVDSVLRDLHGAAGGTASGPETAPTRARVGGAEFAGAVRQVAPAVAGGAQAEFPELGCVLLELDGHEVRLVATDRFRLAVRVLRAGAAEGPSRQVLVDVTEIRDLASWALREAEITLESDEGGTRVLGGGGTRALAVTAGTFPEYRWVLDALPPFAHRVISGRTDLLEAVAAHCGRPAIALRAEDQRLVLSGSGAGSTVLRAVCPGPPLDIAFDPEVLLGALEAAVGPDVLLESSSPTQPVVVRSADQGSFTTLVMPVGRV